MSDDHWFIEVSHDWGWLRRTWFVLTWPLWLAWARLRMWWERWNELPRVARLLLVGLVLLALYAVVFQWVRLPLLRSKGR